MESSFHESLLQIVFPKRSCSRLKLSSCHLPWAFPGWKANPFGCLWWSQPLSTLREGTVQNLIRIRFWYWWFKWFLFHAIRNMFWNMSMLEKTSLDSMAGCMYVYIYSILPYTNRTLRLVFLWICFVVTHVFAKARCSRPRNRAKVLNSGFLRLKRIVVVVNIRVQTIYFKSGFLLKIFG